MKKKWKKIKKVYTSELYERAETRAYDRKVMAVVVAAVAVSCFLTAFANFSKDEILFPVITLCMACVFVLCAVLSVLRPQKRTMVKRIASMALCCVFTIFVVGGYNEGFAPIWAMVIPYATMSVLGLLEGTIVSTYILLMFVILFWTPARSWLLYEYSNVYCSRVPLLYMLCYVVSIYSNYKRQDAQLRIKSEKARLAVLVEEEKRKIAKLTMQTIISISNAVDAKDPYTKKHSERVAKYSKQIANELRWSKQEQENIYNMALLHDIGKIGVPDAILNKHGKLTEEEFPQIRKHPIIGGEILKDLNFVADVSVGAYYHHERYDGTGYPQGLKGEEIPIEARIIGIADSIDAMNSDRVYRGKKDISYVLEQLEAGKGTQFDPNIDEIVIALIKNGKMKL